MKSGYLILVSIVAFTIILNKSYSQDQRLQDAWREYNSAKNAYTSDRNTQATNLFRQAIQYANQCIIDFEPQALSMQDSLTRRRVPCNDCIGTVTPTIRQVCFSRWALNDVATAYFIKGKSVQYLRLINPRIAGGDLVLARNGIRQLSYGRCWNPGGFFWSPCEGLRGNCCPTN